MKIVKPKKLKKGDLIGIISPASTPSDLTRIEKGVNYFERLGYKVIVGKNVGKEYGYLAGSDEERLEDLHSMFADKKVKAVVCVRGGYGSGRLLDKINYRLIKRNPKIFVGYSDITALQMAFLKKAGLVTFAGPMVAVDFHKDEIVEYTEEFFWRIVTSSKKIGKVYNPLNEPFYSLVKGKAEGRIIGGNLAVFNSLMGTQYLPTFKEKILLLEDIGEPPYRVDRMLNQLKLAKAFEQVEGVILGRFVDCVDDDPKTLNLNQVIDHYFSHLNKPVLYNLKHGHIAENMTIPFGIKVKINASRGTVEFLESAVA